MGNPTGWKPSLEAAAKGAGRDLPGLGGATSGLVHVEPLVFEQGSKGRCGVSLPEPERPPDLALPPSLVRDAGIEGMPELSELEVVRHFTHLSSWNHGIDTGFYPLGSCTMKYNPKSSEALASYVVRAVGKLRRQGSSAAFLGVFLATNPFKEEPQYSNFTSARLPVPTSYTPELIALFAKAVKG